MLKEIESLLSLLANEPRDSLIKMDSWQQLIAFYHLSDKSHQDYLIEKLAQLTAIKAETVLAFIELAKSETPPQRSLDAFNDAQLLAKKIETFKERAHELIPRLALHKIQPDEWRELIKYCDSQKRITASFILSRLSLIKKCDTSLLLAYDRDSLPRACRPLFVTTPPPIKRMRHYKGSDADENPLILESSAPESFHSPFKKTGVRIATLSPTTPEQGYRSLKPTPGKTKVRPVYTNAKGRLFKPLTPIGSKTQNGRVDLSQANFNEVQKTLPRPLSQQPQTTHFTATLAKIKARQGHKRLISQNQLAGTSCRKVFGAHRIEVIIKNKGSDYHWSHLFAYFFGGEQSMENLIPGTAASNYNTLEQVEHFVAELLIGGIKSVDIVANLEYSEESLIPNELSYDLSWISPNGKSHLETSIINPRSYQRFTNSMYKSIELLRALDRDEEPVSEIKPS